MSEILMTTWAGAGNTPPMRSVARALVARGHRVHVLADLLLREEFTSVGAYFTAWQNPPQRTRHGRDGDTFRDWEVAEPEEQLGRLRDSVTAGPAPAHAAEVREAIEERRPDVLLCEALLLGPLVAAEATGVPAIVLNPTINLVPAEGVPPFGPGFPPAVTAEDRQRDRFAAARTLELWDVALPSINRARGEHGLPPLEHTLDQGRSAARVLVMTSAAFDFTGRVPPVVSWVGPRLDDAAWAGSDWEAPAGEQPLVLVSLSSDFQDQVGTLQRIADALGTLPVRGVVTTGQGIDPNVVAASPNVRVQMAAPHNLVLREASVCVTHGGHGTTIKALAAGVPVVCLPMGRDQHDVAARLVHRGAGLRVSAGAEPAVIAAAISETLRNTAYATAARRIGAAIAEETASDRVVTEVETLAAATAPVG